MERQGAFSKNMSNQRSLEFLCMVECLRNKYDHIRLTCVDFRDMDNVFISNTSGNIAVKIQNSATFRKNLFEWIAGSDDLTVKTKTPIGL